MEVKNKVTVVKDDVCLGLKVGDVLYYNPVADMYLCLDGVEDVGENSYSSFNREIILSKYIVDRLIKDGVLECDEVKKSQEIANDDCNCDVCLKASETIGAIDWEAYNLGLQLKEMLEENKYVSNFELEKLF